MSDSLSSFIASGIEFIVGGLMLLGATAFLLLAAGWEVPAFLSELDLGAQDASLVVLGIALAAAYAAGVIGEGLSRMMLEWDLDRLTVRNPDFRPREKKPAPPSDTEKQKPKAARPTLMERWTSFRLGGHYTAEMLSERKNERERQRSAAAMHPGLLLDIDSQLKRLRIERVAFLCSVLVGLGFLAAGEWLELLVSVVVAATLLYLVHERFGRYCGAIARAHDHVEAIQEGSGVV